MLLGKLAFLVCWANADLRIIEPQKYFLTSFKKGYSDQALLKDYQ